MIDLDGLTDEFGLDQLLYITSNSEEYRIVHSTMKKMLSNLI
jgi:hypothetical protein